MNLNSNISIKNIVIPIVVTMFFSCNNTLKEVQNVGIETYVPMSIAENINTKYTDSGRLTSILISPKMLNFSNRDFPLRLQLRRLKLMIISN